MDTNTLELVDYFRVRGMVAAYCMSQEGKDALEERLPFTTREEVARHKEESREWTRYLTVKGSGCLNGFGECRPLFARLGVTDYALDLESLATLGQFVKSAIQVKDTLAATAETMKDRLDISLLAEIADSIPNLEGAKTSIYRVIDESGALRDLPELREIRAAIRKKQNEIEAIIRSYTGNQSLRGSLQSDVPVLRGGRQVLAVKSGARGRIPGIVHELSQTGQTVFIEPEDLVLKNNELVQEEFHLSQAIHAILRSVTAELGAAKADLETAHQLVLRLDMSLAGAKWGIENKCTYAFDLPAQGSPFAAPELIAARHPLLGSRAVPITVKFPREANGGRGHRMLIITGPNTGGKTVTLKTIALLSLLNQSGFPIPAAEGTALPLFTGVFADIGDEQSLDESLSTFSGHMKNIANILENATPQSLVLLDELGSGTDPQEGSAIAMAVLDSLIERDAFVLVTTHHGILKNYGYTHPSVTNASVEFGTETLAPTYHILMGVPGESHALDIARHSGLPGGVVEQAEKYISNNQVDISALIQGLNQKHAELARQEEEFKRKEREINERWRKVDLKNLRVKQHEMELREQGYRQSRAFLDESRKMLENLVRELREGEITREKTLKVKETIAELSSAVEAEKAALDKAEETLARDTAFGAAASEAAGLEAGIAFGAGAAFGAGGTTGGTDAVQTREAGTAGAGSFSAGDEVIYLRTNQTGTVVQKAKNDSYTVQFGSMKMNVKPKDLVLSPHQTKPSVSVEIAAGDDDRAGASADTASRGGARSDADRIQFGVIKSDRPVMELRLLGMRYEEAEKALIRQLDLCAIHSFKEFAVIHGKGNGVLQEMVHKVLKEYGAVEEFHFAKPEEGGFGKTYVRLR